MPRLEPRLCHCGIPLLLLLAAAFGGCSGDDPTQPSGSAVPTFTEIWPAGVGAYWEFAVEDRDYEIPYQTYARPEDVPPLPSMAELYAALQSGLPGSPIQESSGDYRVEFTAEDLSDPGLESFMVGRSWNNRTGGYASSPLSLGMYETWTRSSDRIAVYSDGALQWVHLDGALTPGHEFRVQLAAGFDSIFFLDCRIWKYSSFRVMGEVRENCLECFYVLDSGIQQGTDENGDPTGFFHAYIYGQIVYAPGVGPVSCRERIMSPGLETEQIATLQDQGVATGAVNTPVRTK